MSHVQGASVYGHTVQQSWVSEGDISGPSVYRRCGRLGRCTDILAQALGRCVQGCCASVRKAAKFRETSIGIDAVLALVGTYFGILKGEVGSYLSPG